MADEWTEEEAAPRKSGISAWVWGCGGCGLLAAIIAIVGVVFLIDQVKQATDPKVVWPKIGEILAFEERPSGYDAYGGEWGGSGFFMIIVEKKELLGVLILGSGEDQAELDKLFSGEFESGGAFGFGGIKDTEPLDVTIKGQSYRGVRFQATTVGGPASQHKGGGPASILLLDLSPDPSHFVMLELFDLSGDETNQEDVDAFMEPFDPRG
jgi:hypothetical protein